MRSSETFKKRKKKEKKVMIGGKRRTLVDKLLIELAIIIFGKITT
jgi:hypothetical protein